MSKQPKVKVKKPTAGEDDAAKTAAAEAERRRAVSQRGRSASVFSPYGAYGRAESAAAGLRSSFG